MDDYIQMRAFARQDGALLSLLWIASMAFLMLTPMASFGNLLAIGTPFFAGWRLKIFRDEALGGAISFRRGFGYGCLTFFFASIIFAVAQYAYFRFLDNGTFLGTLLTAADTVSKVYVEQGIPQSDVDAAIGAMKALTMVEWTLLFLVQNIIIGAALSVPIALICMRRKK